MSKLSIQTWILDAAAVVSGTHGSVTRQAERSGCSRETVYQHARKVEQRLADGPSTESATAKLEAENRQLRDRIAELKRQTDGRIPCGKAEQRKLATIACAMGISLRQVENLLGVLLPAEQVPDHTTLGRCVQEESRRAGAVLQALDAASTPQVETLAVDEIFFGGDRPLWGSSRRACRPSSATTRPTARRRRGRRA